ncbi:beta-ketoacyl reductase, partial [Kitasatospora sp. NPDC086801]|uniref:beta-ketoacyl reductase n=1 Tax=Kitasatospora sp. NPDC086801 TaxID=3364066 RepID=UPI0037F412A7
LDALAVHRRGQGLPAQSLAWGLWDQASGMTGGLSKADRVRMSRNGVLPFHVSEGLALFDKAVGHEAAIVVPVRLDLTVLGANESLPLFRGLVRGPSLRKAANADAGALRQRLVGVSSEDREAALLDLVRTHAAATLGHVDPAVIQPEQAFSELGFDSLSAVEFRNSVNVSTGLRLSSTLVFDYPNALALVRRLAEELVPEGADDDDTEETVRRALGSIPISRLRDAGMLAGLLELAGVRAEEHVQDDPGDEPSIDEMDADSLINMALQSAGLDDSMPEV